MRARGESMAGRGVQYNPAGLRRRRVVGVRSRLGSIVVLGALGCALLGVCVAATAQARRTTLSNDRRHGNHRRLGVAEWMGFGGEEQAADADMVVAQGNEGVASGPQTREPGAEAEGIIWSDPRRDETCRAAEPRVPGGDQSMRSHENLFTPFGLNYVTQEERSGGEWCLKPNAEFPTWHFYGSASAAGEVSYVRNLKAGTTSTLKWIAGQKIYRIRENKDRWTGIFTPLRFTVVRHPITRFASALGTIHRLLETRALPRMPSGGGAHTPDPAVLTSDLLSKQERDWFRIGGFADAVLDVLEQMGDKTISDEFHLGLRTHPLILHHAYTQMWFFSAPPCPIEAFKKGMSTLSSDRVDVDAILRVEDLGRHSNALRQHPDWRAYMPRTAIPWLHRHDGRPESRRLAAAPVRRKSRGRRARPQSSSTSRTAKEPARRRAPSSRKRASNRAQSVHRHRPANHMENPPAEPTTLYMPCRLVARLVQYYLTDFACLNYTIPHECLGSSADPSATKFLRLSSTDV